MGQTNDMRTLQWLTANKQPPRAAIPVGDILQSQLAACMAGAAVAVDRIQAALEPVLDPPFRAHCSILGYHGGVLTVQVDDPARAAEFRRRYLFVLREQLHQRMPQLRVKDIRFTVLR